MISGLGLAISRLFRKTCPDPFVLAIALTGISFALVVFVPVQTLEDGGMTATSVTDAIGFWRDGLWALLPFSMQMCLILVTGHALASSPPIARAIQALAAIPKTMTSAVVLVAGVTMLFAVLNWGLGLIAGALFAREMGRSLQRRNIAHHYPLLVAAGYLGMLVWHGGFSGSAPLKVTQASQVQEIFKGLDISFETMPLDETILSPLNLLLTGGALVIALIMCALLVPRNKEQMESIETFNVPQSIPDERQPRASLPDWLESTPVFSLLLAAPIFWIAYDTIRSGQWKTMSPNEINLIFLGLGLICHGTPRRYAAAVGDAAQGCAGIILQFPLYAGILGLLKTSGMTVAFAEQIASWSNDTTLPVFTFLSAGVVNLFVPSGGGQWAIQGPIAMQAATEAGVPYHKALLSVAYGDQLTNMLQPFWALPLLAITGVKARDIVGYTAVIMLAVAIWFIVGLLLF